MSKLTRQQTDKSEDATQCNQRDEDKRCEPKSKWRSTSQ